MIGNAVRVMQIATGEEVESEPVDDGQDPAAKTRAAVDAMLKKRIREVTSFGSERNDAEVQARRWVAVRAVAATAHLRRSCRVSAAGA